MLKTLTTFRKISLMPIFAVVLPFLLVFGQVFNCCRFNETFAESVGNVARALGNWMSPAAAPPGNQVSAHPGCQGHSPSEKSQVVASFQDLAGSHLKAEEMCLSESSVPPKALKSSGSFQTTIFNHSPAILPENAILPLACIEKPRPQNKSSPPVYLLTLRILV